jgi:hypothetical protein
MRLHFGWPKFNCSYFSGHRIASSEAIAHRDAACTQPVFLGEGASCQVPKLVTFREDTMCIPSVQGTPRLFRIGDTLDSQTLYSAFNGSPCVAMQSSPAAQELIETPLTDAPSVSDVVAP